MSDGFIIRYKVLSLSKLPIGGRDIILYRSTDPNEAIEWAKNYSKSHRSDDIAVVKFRYTSEKNLEKDFHFDYDCPLWTSYF